MTAPVERNGESIPMTAPIAVGRGRGRSVPMTAPVESDERDEGVRMAFYLPAAYDLESAPHPTEGSVELVAVPERTLSVRRFSWCRPTDGSTARPTGCSRRSIESTFESSASRSSWATRGRGPCRSSGETRSPSRSKRARREPRPFIRALSDRAGAVIADEETNR